MEHYTLHALDPSGDIVCVPWRSRIVPRAGDILMLRDGTRHFQDVEVTSVELYDDGRVEVWLAGFADWSPGSVTELFENARTTPVRELRPLPALTD